MSYEDSPANILSRELTFKGREIARGNKPNKMLGAVSLAMEAGVLTVPFLIFCAVNGITSPTLLVEYLNRAVASLEQSGREKAGAANNLTSSGIQTGAYQRGGIFGQIHQGIGGETDPSRTEFNSRMATLAAPPKLITSTPTQTIPARTITPAPDKKVQPTATKPPVPSPTLRK